MVLIKTIVLIALLIVTIFVQTGLLVFTNPALATALSVVLLFGLPGFVITDLVFGQDELSLPEKLPLSFVLGIMVLILPATLLLVLRSSLDILIWISIALDVILVFCYTARYLREYKTAHPPSPERPRNRALGGGYLNAESLSLSITFILFITFMIYLFATIPIIYLWGDRWSYLAYVQKYLEYPHLDPAGTLYAFSDARIARIGWVVLLALISRVSGVHPVDVYSLYLPPLLAVISVLCFYTLAKALFEKPNVALFAALIQIVYLASAMNPDVGAGRPGVGLATFMRICEDKFAAMLVLLPIALAFMLWYLRYGRPRHLAVFALSIAALTVTHPIGYALSGLSLGSFALIYILASAWSPSELRMGQETRGLPTHSISRIHQTWRRLSNSREKVVRFAMMFAVVGVLAIIPLGSKRIVAEAGYKAFTSEEISEDSLDFESLRTGKRHVLLFRLDKYMAAPTLIARPMIILALLLTPLLIRLIHKDLAAQFLFSNMVIPLAVIYNPWTAPLLGRLISPLQIWRVGFILPVSLVIGFVLYQLIELLRRRLPEVYPMGQRPGLLSVAPVLVVALAVTLLNGEIRAGINYLQEQHRENTISKDERDMLNHLSGFLASESVVLADQMTNSHVPAFAAGVQTLTFRNWTIDLRAVKNIEQFYGVKFVDNSVIGMLKRYSVQYIVMEANTQLAFQLKMLSLMFPLLYQNDTYELYGVSPGIQPNHVTTGNTYLGSGEWDEAIAEYEKALALYPENTLAYWGLGQVYQAQARGEEAQAAYRRAIAVCPDNVLARISLAKIYAAEGRTEEAISQYQEAIRLRPDYLASFEALGDLYRAQGELDEAFRQYGKAIDFPSDTGDYRLALGDLCWVKGLPERAIGEYKEAITLGPRSERAVRAYLGLGNAYQVEGRLDDAAAAYQQAIALAPDNEFGYTRLGSIYLAEGLTGQAIALYRDAARRNFNSAWPHIELGKIYLRQEITRVGDETN